MDVKTSEQKQPELPIKTRLLISASTLAGKLCARSDGTINRRLFNLLEPKAIALSTKLVFNNTPISSCGISIDPSRNLWFRLFLPKTCSSGACRRCIRLTTAIPPEHKFPCAYEDGFDTLKYIDAQNYAVLPSDTDLIKCFIAGGNIAHHVTSKACKKPKEFKKLKIVGLLVLQPFFEGEERTESELRLKKAPTIESTDRTWRNFLPEGANGNHEAANVFGGGSNCIKAEDVLAGEFPSEVLVFIGGFDPLQDWQKRYSEGLRKCGKEKLVEYPNAIHGFYCFP